MVKLILPTLMSGPVVGWPFGPRAWRDARRQDRALTSLAMALAATAIGAYPIALMLSLEAAIRQFHGLETVVAQTILGSLILWNAGVVLLGVMAVPVTFGVALAWSTIMRRLAPGGWNP